MLCPLNISQLSERPHTLWVCFVLPYLMFLSLLLEIKKHVPLLIPQGMIMIFHTEQRLPCRVIFFLFTPAFFSCWTATSKKLFASIRIRLMRDVFVPCMPTAILKTCTISTISNLRHFLTVPVFVSWVWFGSAKRETSFSCALLICTFFSWPGFGFGASFPKRALMLD